MKRTTLLVITTVVAGLAAPASADGPAAKPHVDAGVKAYTAGDYETASREFEAAFALDPDPNVLYAWAQARRQGGRCAEAVALYQRYLGTGPTEAQIAAARTGISLCDRARPVPDVARVSPSPPPREPERSQWYQDRLGGALTIGGAVVAGVGVTFLFLSKRSESAALGAFARDEFGELLDEATMRRRIGVVGCGVGAALVIGGIVRYATRGERAAPPVAIRATATSVSVVGRF
jgi:tetratricopeptide (TPR) repeat protein